MFLWKKKVFGHCDDTGYYYFATKSFCVIQMSKLKRNDFKKNVKMKKDQEIIFPKDFPSWHYG